MKTKRTQTAPARQPIQIEIESIAPLKMQAILTLCNAVSDLAAAISSTCTIVNIDDGTFTGACGRVAPHLTINTRD
ncbi:MAG: hypothetical protein EOP87_00065 [Verrucomicrobiaceae bacterium]|nr:MAG: hypothetical protein EOP87_00065 [Verrucomicrobiaceae bacterium]